MGASGCFNSQGNLLLLVAQPQQPGYNNGAFSYEEKVREQNDCFTALQEARRRCFDEWEYVCAAGSRALFYWVDEEFEYRSEASSWSELCNAFGLAIARDAINIDGPYDYEWEYCADPTIMKGFDGGLIGYETAFLALASAYRQLLRDEQVSRGTSGGCFRRVLGLREV